MSAYIVNVRNDVTADNVQDALVGSLAGDDLWVYDADSHAFQGIFTVREDKNLTWRPLV